MYAVIDTVDIEPIRRTSRRFAFRGKQLGDLIFLIMPTALILHQLSQDLAVLQQSRSHTVCEEFNRRRSNADSVKKNDSNSRFV